MQAVNFAGNALGGRLLPWDDLLLDPGERRRYDYIPLNDEVATKTAAAVAAARGRIDGEPSATVRDAFLKEFVSVVEFFADRYDLVFTPGVTLQVMEDSSGGVRGLRGLPVEGLRKCDRPRLRYCDRVRGPPTTRSFRLASSVEAPIAC